MGVGEREESFFFKLGKTMSYRQPSAQDSLVHLVSLFSPLILSLMFCEARGMLNVPFKGAVFSVFPAELVGNDQFRKAAPTLKWLESLIILQTDK